RVRQGRFMSAIARLKPGVTVEQAQAEMTAIAGRLEEQYKEFNNGWGVNLVPIKDQLVGDIRPALLVLLGAVAFVLLIACANVANLLLARAASRQKEIAIRTALGAGRWRVVRQLLTESVILASVGGVLGLLLAMWGTDLLLALSPKDLLGIKDIGINPQVLGFTLIVSVATGIIFGLVPAMTASRPNLNLALKEGGKTSANDGGGHGLRNLFVVAQVALALVLLIGSGLMIKSFMRLQSVDPGFQPENLLSVRVLLPASKYREDHQVINFFNQIVERTEAIPGVRSASAINFLPFTGLAAATGFTIVGRPQPGVGEQPGTEVRVVQPGYFETMGIPILKGRTFTDREATELSHVVIVNEAMVKEHFPNEDPLGQKLVIDMMDKPVPCEIVGVVGDVKHHGLDVEVRPFAYWPPPELTYSFMSIVVRTDSDPNAIAAAIQREVSVMDKDLPVADIRLMRDLVSDSLASSRFSTLLLTIFAGVALVLAAVGIYGVMSYSVTQRTHEIGIRMALGAGRSNVLRLVVGRGMLLTVIGLVIGLVAAFALTRFLTSLLFGISAVDPITFAMLTGVLGAISFAACYIPALRATRVDPMIALRYE
ncbi:MAG TPA: ABC transporter permease, partial [Blastocatellia bacterium]|nr:ABC transporter permease [Blastocatellia bacterium]